VRRTIVYLVAFCQHLSLFSELLNTDQLHRILFLLLSQEAHTTFKVKDKATRLLHDLHAQSHLVVL